MAVAALGFFCACVMSSASLWWEMMGGSKDTIFPCLLERSGPVGQTGATVGWTDCPKQAPAAHSITSDKVMDKGVGQSQESTHRNTVPGCLSIAGSCSSGRGDPAYLGPTLKREKTG